MKSYELFQNMSPALAREILSYLQKEQNPVFKSVVQTLAAQRNGQDPEGRTTRKWFIALIVLTIVAAVYFWPVWTHGLTTWDAWHDRMWLSTWI